MQHLAVQLQTNNGDSKLPRTQRLLPERRHQPLLHHHGGTGSTLLVKHSDHEGTRGTTFADADKDQRNSCFDIAESDQNRGECGCVVYIQKT